jgi:hypothetical protein
VLGVVPGIHVFLLYQHRFKTWMTGTSPVKGLWIMIEFLMVAGAPAPVAPFSHATACEGWLFVTGQMPTDDADRSGG